MPIILIVLNDKHSAKMKTVAEEVRARGAYTIVITNDPHRFEHESKGLRVMASLLGV
jgi:glucosamine--fructose-6-phosphate aminotransferase (isomerizing)